MPIAHSFLKEALHVHISARYLRMTDGLQQVKAWKSWADFFQNLDTLQISQIHSFVLMSNHFHLLARLSCDNPDQVSGNLQENISLAPSLRSNPLEISITEIKSWAQYRETYRYIYRNPVEAGLSQKAEDYAYSTLPCVLGWRQACYPVIDHMGLINNPRECLKWLNEISSNIERPTRGPLA